MTPRTTRAAPPVAHQGRFDGGRRPWAFLVYPCRSTAARYLWRGRLSRRVGTVGFVPVCIECVHRTAPDHRVTRRRSDAEAAALAFAPPGVFHDLRGVNLHECIDHMRSNGYDGETFFYRCLICGAEYTGQQIDQMHDAALAAEERFAARKKGAA